MKRTIKYNGRSITFPVQVTDPCTVADVLAQLASAKSAKYARKAKVVVGDDGKLETVNASDDRPAVWPVADAHEFTGNAAAADVIVHTVADDLLPQAAQDQLAEIADENGLDLKAHKPTA